MRNAYVQHCGLRNVDFTIDRTASMAVLHMDFLGIATLRLDSAPVHLERRNSLALLAFLVLTNRPHSRESLATLLAADVETAAARKRLRNALADLVEHGLRDYLHTDRQSVAFNAGLTHSLDINMLDELSAAGDGAATDGLAWVAHRCDWELLSGLLTRDAPDFELWLLDERKRREQQLHDLAQRHLVRLLESGQYKAGLDLAQRLLAAEPWNETVHRILMKLHARSGQMASALAQYERYRIALAEELGIEPQPATTALLERLRAGPVAPRHNLVSAVNSGGMIGRDAELDLLTANLVDPTCRLLTIRGLAGSGKTSLALAAATRLAAPAPAGEDPPFPDGVMLIDLTDIPETEPSSGSDNSAERRIASAIGLGLGLVFYGRIDRLEQLIAYLHPKRMLLVLDNMDRWISGAPALLTILRRSPGVTILVTSRSPLGLADEWKHNLGGLQTPETVDELEQAAASHLFLREARRMNVQIRADDRPSIIQICRLTGGWPLAIKIVAGWLGTLTCAEIARELEQHGALLDEPPPSVEARQTSIRSIVEASMHGLLARERLALARLAGFAGPFKRNDAEAVGVTSPSLIALNQRSLLERFEPDSYTLHPLVGHYAYDPLSISMADGIDVRSETGIEDTNLRPVWPGETAPQNAEMLGQLWEDLSAWNQQAGLHREWEAALTAAIDPLRDKHDDPGYAALLTQLLVAKAGALIRQGDMEGAFPLLEEARGYACTSGQRQLDALINICEIQLLRLRDRNNKTRTDMIRQAHAPARTTERLLTEAIGKSTVSDQARPLAPTTGVHELDRPTVRKESQQR